MLQHLCYLAARTLHYSMITETQLREALDSPSELHSLLVNLASSIADNYEWEFDVQVFDGAATAILPKAERFSKEKPGVKAFNFFTTCLLCYLRQVRQARKLHEKLLGQKERDKQTN